MNTFSQEECEIEEFNFGSYTKDKIFNPVIPAQISQMIEFSLIRAKWTQDESLPSDDRERYFNESLESLQSVVLMIENQKAKL